MVSRETYYRLPYIIVLLLALLLIALGSTLRGAILLLFLGIWTPQFDRAMERLHIPLGELAKYILMFVVLLFWLLLLRPQGIGL